VTIRKKPAPAASITDITGDVLTDDRHLHRFVVDGVAVTVESSSVALNPRAASLVSQLHALCSIPPAPPRIEAWGSGQFDRVKLAPGVEAWLRVTPSGRVRMVVPGGDLDVTDGGCSLGTGLHEATDRAAQIRVQLMERARAKAERLGHDPVWTYSRMECRRCEAVGEFGTDGKTRGAVVTERCAP
jgi:hypothetical protein